MVRTAVFLISLLSSLCNGVCQGESTWQIELLSEAATDAAVVRLGDVALVHGLPPHQAQMLNRTVLAPGARPAFARTFSASQVRRILRGRGIDLTGCQLIGAPTAVVRFQAGSETGRDRPLAARESTEMSPWDVVRPATYRTQTGSRFVDNIEDQLVDAVLKELGELTGSQPVWHVAVTFDSRMLKDLPADWEMVSLQGVTTADEGRHDLIARIASNDGVRELPFEAVVTRQVEIVVPTRSLKRGETVTSADVELRHVVFDAVQQSSARSLTEVVGRQVESPLKAGEPIPLDLLKQPILVRRREQIDVYARRAGIRISEQVQSLDQGALGDVVTVERLDGSKTRFVARVVGVQQAEVCVSNASTTSIAQRPHRR